MLYSIVIYCGFLLIVSSVVLFAAGARLRRSHWLASLLLVGAIAVTAWALQAGLFGAALPFATTMAIVLAAGAIVTAAFEQWNAAGHAAFTAIAGAVAAFLAYAVHVVVNASLGPWSLLFAGVLLLLQIGTLVLLVANMFEIVDVLCRVRWYRLSECKIVAGYRPMVSLHVPIHAEPPELVIETLDALARLDYPNYEVLVIDNNTADENLWKPVEAHCARLGGRFRFFHLLPWPGYKSGALNYALTETAPDAEIIGVVDADYVVAQDFLRDLVGHFADDRVAFVQTPQDYRDQVHRGRYGRALYLAYLYFFQVSMATRNEYNGIIYAGTMGLIRRAALESLGGWDEWCVTEDAELSLRLLSAGFESVYIPQTYGRGIMPLDYAGLKKQRFRWAFGGMQILRKHARLLFSPWSGSKLSWAQRLAYINGGLQWLNDPMALAFTAALLLGSTALLFGSTFRSQPLAGATMLMPPLFILFAVMRFVWAFRLRARCSVREALDALIILLGLTWVVALACVRGLISKQGVFLRTPKQAERPTFWDAIRVVWWELLLGLSCLAIAAGMLVSPRANLMSAWSVVVVMLLWQSTVYLSAVRSSAWSYAETRPPLRVKFFTSFHNLGHRSGRLITEPRAALAVVLAAVVIAGLFYVGGTRAPLLERMQWNDPLHQFLPTQAILAATDPAAQVATTIALEGNAARRGDLDAVLQLWAPDGVVIDAAAKPGDATARRVWKGIAQVRERYREEIQQRHYESLRHLNLHVTVNGNEATIVNDLAAVFESNKAIRRVHLRQSDRWVLRKENDRWRIVELEVNRADSTAQPTFANRG